MKKRYILAIDERTTYTRSIIFDHFGKKVAESRLTFAQYFPKSGWIEQNGNEIWNAVSSTIGNVFVNSGIQPNQISGIGISNQRETSLIWDRKTGLPIYNAIVWESRQGARIANNLIKKGLKEDIHQKTGLIIDAYFSATKIRWLLDHVPNAQKKAENGDLLFGTINTWLIWKLTGGKVHVTDYTNASRTMLFNINDLKWDAEILKLLNIPFSILPNVKSNSEIYGKTASYNFYGSRVPISGMAGDQQAALFGQLAFEPGMVKNTYSTGAFIIMNTGQKLQFSQNDLLTTIAYDINGKVNYALEGSVYVAGSAIEWLRDNIKIIENVQESEKIAKKSNNDNEVYVIPAFSGLGAPYWDTNVRGTVLGLSLGTNKEDFIKATLQSLAYLSCDIINTMRKDSNIEISRLKVDGGAATNNYLIQFQSDILNIEIDRSSNLETTATGAAFLAGLSVGYWKNINEIKNIYRVDKIFKPKISYKKRAQLYSGWKLAVKVARNFKP